jgi:glutathione peroxidase-family protein
MASFHEFEMNSITGETVSLSEYRGKTCLVVNLASQ